jgi:hypothetical protein
MVTFEVLSRSLCVAVVLNLWVREDMLEVREVFKTINIKQAQPSH